MRRFSPLVLLAVLFFLPVFAAGPDKLPPTPPEGVLPVGADGKPLNLDFETGTLKDWTAEGNAFKGQPIKGDTVAKRRSDIEERAPGTILDRRLRAASGQGRRHAHVGAVQGHASVGDRSSSAADRGRKLASNWSAPIPKRSSRAPPAPRKRTCAASPSIYGRTWARKSSSVSSISTPGRWGHINFDDFRFHTDKPNVPPRKAAPPPPDVYKYAGLPPEKAAAAMTVPEGFTRLAVRRGAGRLPTDCHMLRRPRPALGSGGVQLSRAPPRQGSEGPHPDLRGQQG